MKTRRTRPDPLVSPAKFPMLFPGMLDNGDGPGRLTPKRPNHGRPRPTRKCKRGGKPVPIRRHCRKKRGVGGTNTVRTPMPDPARSASLKLELKGSMIYSHGVPWKAFPSEHHARSYYYANGGK